MKEQRHVQVMKRQISKFEKLLQRNYSEVQSGHSNLDQNGHSKVDGLEMTRNVPEKWVINLSNTRLLRNKSHSWHIVQIL